MAKRVIDFGGFSLFCCYNFRSVARDDERVGKQLCCGAGDYRKINKFSGDLSRLGAGERNEKFCFESGFELIFLK